MLYLLGNLTEKSKFEDSELSTGGMSSKLESALTAKQESEAKVMSLEQKVKQYEEELAGLKGKVCVLYLFFYSLLNLDKVLLAHLNFDQMS